MMTSFRARATALLSLCFLIAPLVTQPFKGYHPDQLPIPQLDPPIQPAGYAFAIWGLIYSWLVISAVIGLWRYANDPAWDRVRDRLFPALFIGIFWLWIANHSPIWASITIALMAASAITALLAAPEQNRWALRAPIAIFAGWLTAATHVSIGVTLSGYGVLLSPEGWAFAGIASALIIGLAVQLKRPDAQEYGLTLIWALIAIVLDARMDAANVALFAGCAATATALVLAWQQWQRYGR